MIDILLKQMLKPNVKTIVKTRYSQDECQYQYERSQRKTPSMEQRHVSTITDS
jgi:hypothetical protein